MGAKRWSAEEIAVLENIAKSDDTLIGSMHRLPGRSWDAARSMAQKQGFVCSTARRWSEEEREILRKVWEGNLAIKVGLKQLPGRSYDAAKGEAQRLGYTGRTKKIGRLGYSYVETAITSVLSEEIPMTIKELVERTGHSRHAIDTILRRRRGKTFHVESWVRLSRHGDYAAKWTCGGGKDAARPARKPSTQACREWRQREALKRHGFNPFLTVATQVMA